MCATCHVSHVVRNFLPPHSSHNPLTSEDCGPASLLPTPQTHSSDIGRLQTGAVTLSSGFPERLHQRAQRSFEAPCPFRVFLVWLPLPLSFSNADTLTVLLSACRLVRCFLSRCLVGLFVCWFFWYVLPCLILSPNRTLTYSQCCSALIDHLLLRPPPY
jgi:hypothetical protein